MRLARVVFFFFFKQKTAYEMLRGLVGSEMCIGDGLGSSAIVVGVFGMGQWAGGVPGAASGVSGAPPAIVSSSSGPCSSIAASGSAAAAPAGPSRRSAARSTRPSARSVNTF